ncbi:MAG: hypothetical protein P8J66_08870, partial [Verrucomicrobiota bacterium]|nr:hypothetical protein [Verrucomicrobiota bacterium]
RLQALRIGCLLFNKALAPHLGWAFFLNYDQRIATKIVFEGFDAQRLRYNRADRWSGVWRSKRAKHC